MLPHRTDHPLKPLDSRRVWDCPWYGVRQDRISLPDGGEGVYNVVELPDAVWIVPVTADGQIALLYHYRYPLRDWVWELPSGSITRGDTPLETAQRELLEEAGGETDEWRHLMSVNTMKGIGTERAHLFLATGVKLGATQHEPTEVMTVHPLPAQQVVTMAKAGAVADAISVLALLLAEAQL